jgi:hypothetical protein
MATSISDRERRTIIAALMMWEREHGRAPNYMRAAARDADGNESGWRERYGLTFEVC